MQSINSFEMALTAASVGAGQITAASFEQIVQCYANQGQSAGAAPTRLAPPQAP